MKNTIHISHFTIETQEWLDKTCPGKYDISDHQERVIFAGPNKPLSECMASVGFDIWFADEEMKTMFLLKWSDLVAK